MRPWSLAGFVTAVQAALAACSTSSGDDGTIQPDPQAGSGTGDASGAGGENPNWNTQTADLLASRLPGYYSNAAQAEASSGTIPRNHLRACRVLAPELGKRVIYLERSEEAAPDGVREQMVFVIEPMSPAYYEADIRVFRPSDRSAWIGACEGSMDIEAPGDVSELSACDWYASYNDATFSVSVGLDPASPPECIHGSPDGIRSGGTSLNVATGGITWTDFFTFPSGEVRQDPTGADAYEFVRTEGP